MKVDMEMLEEIGVRKNDRPQLLSQIQRIKDKCSRSTLPTHGTMRNAIILEFVTRPFGFEIEWYDYTLTVTQINPAVEKRGLVRGMQVISCNGFVFHRQQFPEMLEVLKNASLPATIKFEKISMKDQSYKTKKKEVHSGYDTYVIKQGWMY